MSLVQLIAQKIIPLRRKLTDERIEKLDNLDKKISEVEFTDDRLDHLDADVSSRLSKTDFDDDTRLNRINTTVSSRVSTSHFDSRCDTTTSSRLSTSTFNGDTRLNRINTTVSSRVSTSHFDSRCDTTTSSRLSTSTFNGDTRLNRIDTTVSSRMRRARSQIFTSSTYWTVPNNVYVIWVTLVGGGGAGGSPPNMKYGYNGGNSGEHLMRYPMPVTPGESLHIVIGYKGTAPSHNSAGGSGGNTYVVSNALTLGVAGGYGGQATTVSQDRRCDYPNVIPSTLGGVAQNITSKQADGECLTKFAPGGTGGTTYGGAGGASSLFGQGGNGGNGSTSGNGQNGGNATGYGAGGGGGGSSTRTSSSTSGLGGDGSSGLVILEWFEV